VIWALLIRVTNASCVDMSVVKFTPSGMDCNQRKTQGITVTVWVSSRDDATEYDSICTKKGTHLSNYHTGRAI
jgi:hypothetical protein